MLNRFINRPYDIIEQQKAFQSSPKPLHHRLPGRQLKIRAFAVGFTGAAVYTVYGVYVLVRGKQ
ncbi:hypothetical protein C8J56DRAFT_1053819 [Mycena floridula]|nr:hypothetical protein C8J56DRAFT_1053819 [Mycena floridula]